MLVLALTGMLLSAPAVCGLTMAEPAAASRGGAEGRWRLLIVAEDWCGDSANAIPYLARLERPAALSEWLEAGKSRLPEDELRQSRDAWRRQDAGQSTIREIVELVEAALQGSPRCGGTGH